MKIKVEYFGNPDDCMWFDSSDKEKIAVMLRDIHDPTNDVSIYYTEDGHMIFHWPLDGNDDDEYDEYFHNGYSRIGIDFSPSNPWDAPGMCVSDFIR